MEHSPGGPADLLRTKHALFAALVITAIVAAYSTGFAWAGDATVTITCDGELTELKTEAQDVSGVLAEAGIEVGEGDLVTPPLETPVEDGLTVVVKHAVPVVLDFAGERVEVPVLGSTVADALTSIGLDPSSGVSVSPSLDSTLEPGMTVAVKDVYVRVVAEEMEIPFETEEVEDPELLAGTRAVKTEGRPGRLLRIYRVRVADGQEAGRVLLAEKVTERPVAEVVAVGTKPVRSSTQLASRGAHRSIPPAPESGEKIRVVATAYSPGHGCGFTTATGARAGYGIIAVDPAVIPLGTRLYVPGYGYGIAADTGGAISGDRIDLCFDTVAEALAWGRRTVTVTIAD